MRRARLPRMGINELVCRGRQEASKWLERAGAIKRNGPRLRHPIDVERFRAFGPRRFFEGAVSEGTPRLLIDRMPAARDEVVNAAEAVCRGSFDLLGYSGLRFGKPVDWDLDPVAGRRAPLVHWSRLDPLDPTLVGDSKVIWELNRHQWLIRLGQAYRLTGDGRYADAFAAYIRQWMDANPPGTGINWASSLEVALRLISWCWSLFLFRESPALSPELFARMVEGIWTHAAHVERYLSYYFSPNTHLTGEALGLFYAGLLFPDLPLAERWRALGGRILVDQSERQILPDGVYFEQSTGYQRYTLEIYLHFLILGARNAWPIPAAVSARVARMLDFLLSVRLPDGSMPQIGDADGGSLLPLIRRAQDDFRGVFGPAAALFDRADCAWASGTAIPEVLWLLGPEGLRAFDALQPAPPSSPTRLFADGGYVIMRSGWEPDGHQLIFDVGPLGCPVSGGHGHADLLAVQCAAFGEPYLVDAGTYCYAGGPAWRDFFRGTAAHTTLIVDGEPQAVPAGPFRWRERPSARLRQWCSTPEFDFADADHDAYARLADPVVHRRRVLFVRGGYWVLVDDLEGTGEHRVELRFQLARIEVDVEPLWARAHGREGQGLLIRPFARIPLRASVHTGEIHPIQGWVSAEYGQRRPAPMLVYSAVTRLPLRIVTLLLPTLYPLAAPPAVAPLLGDDAAPVGLVFEDWDESVSFGDLGVLVTRPGRERREP
ncbi:MAG: alginate lyase family protein [Candidatus Rokubacteria bacterium]|nr:alginate lyase family protein [Candidatus Rokubacteria bacterium]